MEEPLMSEKYQEITSRTIQSGMEIQEKTELAIEWTTVIQKI